MTRAGSLFKVKLVYREPASLSFPSLIQRQDRVETAGGHVGYRSCRKRTSMPAHRLRGSTAKSTAEVILLGGSSWSRVRGCCSETELGPVR